MLGSEFHKSAYLSVFERLYIWLFGMPIVGLRIRAWRMIPIIKKHLQNAKRVLDMGSGRGVFTIEIAKALPDAEVIGVDLLPQKVRAANDLVKQIGLNNCTFETVDIFSKEFSQTFDSIVAIDVLEHIENDIDVVKRLYNILRPGGSLIIHVPHKYRNLFGIRRINFDIEGHVRPGYLMEELELLLNKANFNISEKGYTYSSFETLGNDLSYMITKGREQNKMLYSLCFPFLLLIAYIGKSVTPHYGSGLFIVGTTSSNTATAKALEQP